jgi:hypothetical protein
LADHRRVPSRVGYRCTRSAEFRSIRIAASRSWTNLEDMFVPHVLGFLPPPVVESVVSCGCSRLEESGSLYLVDPIAIIEVRGEEVLASTLDGDRMWRRGLGVPGGSGLCLRDWFGTYMEMISVHALLLLHRKPELLPCLFSYPLEDRPLKAAYSR